MYNLNNNQTSIIWSHVIFYKLLSKTYRFRVIGDLLKVVGWQKVRFSQKVCLHQEGLWIGDPLWFARRRRLRTSSLNEPVKTTKWRKQAAIVQMDMKYGYDFETFNNGFLVKNCIRISRHLRTISFFLPNSKLGTACSIYHRWARGVSGV